VSNEGGTAVLREDLIADVWEQDVARSNVVDAVVRTLRRKLASWAPTVETVVGHGYRFRQWTKQPRASG
jgi:DNA-binding response OmpR family regulator